MRPLSHCLLFVACCAAPWLSAASVTFDFESVAPTETGETHPGGLTSLVTSNAGVTLTLSRSGGAAFDVDHEGAGAIYPFPASFGLQALDGFATTANPANYFVGNFSTPVSGASIRFGDYGGDDDLLTLTGYSGLNGTGSVLATQTVDYPLALNLFTTGDIGLASIAAPGIQSITFSSIGTAGADISYNSLFYDNLAVTTPAAAAPLPAGAYAGLTTLAALLGVGALRGRRRVANLDPG